jgi:hypothetical protein
MKSGAHSSLRLRPSLARAIYHSCRQGQIRTRGAVPYSQTLPSPKESVPVVVLAGKAIAPDYDPLYSIGFLVVVMKQVDPTLTDVLMLNYYCMDLWGQDLNYTALFDEMARQIEAVTHELGDYILVVASFNWNYYAPPSVAFQGVLRGAGAGSVLDQWVSGQGDSAGSIGTGYDCTYCLVGRGGTSRTAAETMDVASSPGPVSTRMRARIDERGDVVHLNAG